MLFYRRWYAWQYVIRFEPRRGKSRMRFETYITFIELLLTIVIIRGVTTSYLDLTPVRNNLDHLIGQISLAVAFEIQPAISGIFSI